MKALRIKSGSSVVRVFTSRSGKYTRFELRWTDHRGTRRRVKHSKRAVAIAEARRIAEDLARGHHRAELTLADLASFRAGIVNLYGTGKTLETATAEYAEVFRLLLSRLNCAVDALPSLATLARHWLDTRTAPSLGHTTISEFVETYLAQLKTRGLSARHQEDLRARLRKYATENPAPLIEHTAARVQSWVLSLDVAPRTRNNYLAAVQTLFADAAASTHPHAPGIRLIKPSVLREVRKAIWTPKEMSKLLTNAVRFDAPLVPLLVLGGFAKLRASEAIAMRASDLRLDDAQALLQTGKTGSRVIPLPANAVAWLRAYAPQDGPLWEMSVDAYNAHCRALAERCEVKWRPNALRKSAQLYAILLDPNYDRVAREAGNSPKMLRAHYVDPNLATKTDAEAWFALMPPKSPSIIIPMEQTA